MGTAELMPAWFVPAIGCYVGLLAMIGFAVDGHVTLANWFALITAFNFMFYRRARKRGG